MYSQLRQRRTLGYFVERKFSLPQVTAELQKYGFEQGNYQRIIVTWGATAEAKTEAQRQDIELSGFSGFAATDAPLANRDHTGHTSQMILQGRFNFSRWRVTIGSPQRLTRRCGEPHPALIRSVLCSEFIQLAAVRAIGRGR